MLNVSNAGNFIQAQATENGNKLNLFKVNTRKPQNLRSSYALLDSLDVLHAHSYPSCAS